MLLNNNLNSLKIIAKGLVPIIEPEVNINAKDKAEIEEVLKAELKRLRCFKRRSISNVKINYPN